MNKKTANRAYSERLERGMRVLKKMGREKLNLKTLPPKMFKMSAGHLFGDVWGHTGRHGLNDIIGLPVVPEPNSLRPVRGLQQKGPAFIGRVSALKARSIGKHQSDEMAGGADARRCH